MSLLTKATELGLLQTEPEPIGIAKKFAECEIDYLGKAYAQFKGVEYSIEGSYQSNDGDDLTTDYRCIALALFQELGTKHIIQMTPAQAASIYAWCYGLVVDAFSASAKRKAGYKQLPVVYNATKDARRGVNFPLERGFARPLGEVYVKRWNRWDSILIVYRKTLTIFDVNGESLTKDL